MLCATTLVKAHFVTGHSNNIASKPNHLIGTLSFANLHNGYIWISNIVSFVKLKYRTPDNADCKKNQGFTDSKFLCSIGHIHQNKALDFPFVYKLQNTAIQVFKILIRWVYFLQNSDQCFKFCIASSIFRFIHYVSVRDPCSSLS